MVEIAQADIVPDKSQETLSLEHDRQLLSCRFSPCGQYVVAAGTDAKVHRWHLESSQHTPFPGHSSWISCHEFHPDQKRLITTDYVGTIHCWEYAAEEPKSLWSVTDAHQGSIRALAISSDGRTLATAGHDRIVRIWSTVDGTKIHEFAGHESPVFALAFHPDGVNLVSGEQFGIVKQWHVAEKSEVRTLDGSMFWSDASLDGGAWSCGIRSLVFDASGKELACTGITELKDGDRRGGNGTVLILDWESGKQIQLLQAKGAGYVERVVFHPAGYLIAACLTQENGSIQFWKRDGLEPIHSIKSGCRELDLHPDGERIAVAEWKLQGKAGNNPSSEKLEAYEWHHGVVRLFKMVPSPQ